MRSNQLSYLAKKNKQSQLLRNGGAKVGFFIDLCKFGLKNFAGKCFMQLKSETYGKSSAIV